MPRTEHNLEDAVFTECHLSVRDRWTAFRRTVKALWRNDPHEDMSIDRAAWAIFRSHPVYRRWYYVVRHEKMAQDRLTCSRSMRNIFYRSNRFVFVLGRKAVRRSDGRLVIDYTKD